MSYFIDVGEQDKALADQIAIDQETLASLHQTTVDTRTRTNDLRQETAAQKRALDASLARSRTPRPSSRKLEKRTPRRSRQQKRDYLTLARNKAAAAAIIPKAARRRSGCQRQIDDAHPASRSSAATSRPSSTARCAGRWTAT